MHNVARSISGVVCWRDTDDPGKTLLKDSRTVSIVVLLSFFALALPGCGNPPVVSNKSAPEEQPQENVKPPDAATPLSTTASANVDTKPAPDSQPKRAGYVQKRAYQSGHLKGTCRFTNFKIRAPARVPIDTNKLILNPKPRESEYYSAFKYNSPSWIGNSGEVCGAVVSIRGIKAGTKPELDRPTLNIWGGGFTLGGVWHSASPYARYVLLNKNDSVLYRNCDPFDSDLAIISMSTNKEFCKTRVPLATHKSGAEGEALDAWNKHTLATRESDQTLFMYNTKTYPSEPITECGYYLISSKSHPWQNTCLVVVENPYVALPDQTMKDGQFKIENIPVGKHTVEVWHPVCKPVKSTYEIEIKDEEEVSLLVQFDSPPAAGDGVPQN